MQHSTGTTTSEPKQPVGSLSHTMPLLRLNVLDGIRGLAAIYVALFHAMGYAGYLTTLQTQASAPARLLGAMLDYGAYAVPVFIVLSGFCLMLPLAQRQTTYVAGGVFAYIRRRAWRILPSYYVALLLFLGLIAAVPALQTPQNTAWDTKIPVTAGAIFSHLLLIHNVLPNWIYKIDGPMWSIATEWQIYFLFPALLLPILRRSNVAISAGFALALGLLPHFVLPNAMNLDIMHPWFLGLFAMGMAGAHIVFSNDSRVVRYRAMLLRGWTNVALTLLVVGVIALKKDWMDWHPYIAEPLVGCIVMCWLIQYASAVRQEARRSFSQRVLESRLLVGLGGFSYSIYLIHNPIQGLLNLETLNLNISADTRLALMLGVVTPFAVLCSYAFYILVERRCMRMKERIVSTPQATTGLFRRSAPLEEAQEQH